MTAARIIQFKKLNLVGKSLPRVNDHGHIGRHIHDTVDNHGYAMNPGRGADIRMPGCQPAEVKSRDEDSRSPHSVGSMHEQDIINTCYEQTILWEKLQTQLRVKYRNHVIQSQEIYDFSRPIIQQKLRDAYETARHNLIQGNYDSSNYVPGTGFGHFERCANSDQWTFRIGNKGMQQLEAMARSTFDRLFDYD